jgi:outer membrane protein assembly factor BamB
MGHLNCLDAAKGTVLWKKDLASEYKIQRLVWGISASPLVDGDRVIVQVGAADGACLVAFDTKTGAERWRAVKDRASYSAPILIQQAGKRVVVCWTERTVVGLNPETGRLYWEYRYNAGNVVMNVATPVVDRNRLFVSAFFDGSIMLRLAENELKVEKMWQRRGESITKTDSLHSTITTDFIEGDYVYGIDSFGQLRCLKAENGDRVWENLTITPRERWGTVHLVRNGDRTWLFTERGELIIAKLTPAGYQEIDRAQLIEPTTEGVGRKVCWSHPAFAYRCVFARNDRELICVNLARP